ncbi:MAG: GT4 family glycosyltransferase PelF, partial [Actinomycetota bacterium]|nr:GT4 family glycosyltransferase PelF [Actinomycetota bacterium]
MRVTLLNEGTYPYVRGGVSVWCDQLVRALPDVEVDLLTLTSTGCEVPSWELPANVRSLRSVPLWGELPAGRAPRGPARRAILHAFADLAEAIAARDGAGADACFSSALRRLVEPARAGSLSHVLRSDEAVMTLAKMWRRGRDPRRTPVLSLHEALSATVLLEHSLRPLAVRLEPMDLTHAVANGLPALVGVVAKWESGTPMLMSEHGVYLRERYLSYRESALGPGTRAVLLGFFRRLSALGYREAEYVAPVSDFNRRWEERGGAAPGTVVTVHNGVDPERFPPLPGEPAEPVLTWVGRVDPLKDLPTLLRAFALVRQEIPAARLRVFGPVPAGNEAYAEECRRLAAELGITDATTFEGPVPSSREGFAHGQVVVLSSISEGLPYSVIEATMCGRATVSTDVGGVAECVGDAGVVTPARDPRAFAAACVDLLRD